ncbi:MAG: hypothetical protein GXO83_04915 [Chlorobi bacterium]|nr:hypothetical protein [Chlorobiota bacterium]
MKLLFRIVAGAILVTPLMITGCKKNDEPQKPDTLAYVGSEVCQTCHQDKYDNFIKTGHPYKLNKVVDGKAPTYPYSTVPNPPTGYTWNDVTYVIGGYGWKARFIDNDGYIVTGDAVQYNLATQGWVAYHASDAPGTVKYNCGRCHTTGWKSVADGGQPQDGLPGMDGEFFAGGIQCESCHGMGNVHAFTQDKADITVNTDKTLCGSCHYRNENHTIDASGGFIKHHEQYDELIAAGHNVLDCVSCHSPHKTSIYNGSPGVEAQCTDCHTKTQKHNAAATCTDCHMPHISKSAVKTNEYMGDIATHIFKINTDTTAAQFSTDGKTANPYVTLAFACYGCHKDPDGVGGSGSVKTLSELNALAKGMHN